MDVLSGDQYGPLSKQYWFRYEYNYPSYYDQWIILFWWYL